MSDTLRSRWIRLRDSLRLRLVITAVVVIVTVSAISTFIDYQRERATLVDRVVTALQDQARLLELELDADKPREVIQQYVRRFCETLNAHISPGHIILVLNDKGRIVAESASPQENDAKRALIDVGQSRSIIRVNERDYVQARLPVDDGIIIVVAQDMANVNREMRGMLSSHIASTIAAAGSVMLLLCLGMYFWAIRPFRRLAHAAKAWASKDFAARPTLPGPSELWSLTGELDHMAEILHWHETHRLSDMERARKIQANLLPRLTCNSHGMKVSARYWPMEHVAGDLYDLFELPDGRLVTAVVDIAGHGVSAALLTGIVKMSLRYRLEQSLDLSVALEQVNADLLACTLGQKFAVASIGIWNAVAGAWTYAAAGHEGCTTIIGRHIQHLESTGPMLGILPNGRWDIIEVPLKPGDRVFLYSDGVTESGVLGESQLGSRGVGDLLSECDSQSLDGQVESIIAEVERRGQGTTTDDTTILAFEIAAAPSLQMQSATA